MNNKFKRLLIGIVVMLVIGSCIFMFLISPISTKDNIIEPHNIEMVEANATTDELTKGLVVEQKFTNTVENINEVAIVFSRLYYLEEKDADNTIAIELLDGNKVLASTVLKSNDIPDQHRVYIDLSSSINGYLGKELTIRVYENSKCDTGLVLMINTDANDSIKFGNNKINGSICFSITGE